MAAPGNPLYVSGGAVKLTAPLSAWLGLRFRFAQGLRGGAAGGARSVGQSLDCQVSEWGAPCRGESRRPATVHSRGVIGSGAAGRQMRKRPLNRSMLVYRAVRPVSNV